MRVHYRALSLSPWVRAQFWLARRLGRQVTARESNVLMKGYRWLGGVYVVGVEIQL